MTKSHTLSLGGVSAVEKGNEVNVEEAMAFLKTFGFGAGEEIIVDILGGLEELVSSDHEKRLIRLAVDFVRDGSGDNSEEGLRDYLIQNGISGGEERVITGNVDTADLGSGSDAISLGAGVKEVNGAINTTLQLGGAGDVVMKDVSKQEVVAAAAVKKPKSLTLMLGVLGGVGNGNGRVSDTIATETRVFEFGKTVDAVNASMDMSLKGSVPQNLELVRRATFWVDVKQREADVSPQGVYLDNVGVRMLEPGSETEAYRMNELYQEGVRLGSKGLTADVSVDDDGLRAEFVTSVFQAGVESGAALKRILEGGSNVSYDSESGAIYFQSSDGYDFKYFHIERLPVDKLWSKSPITITNSGVVSLAQVSIEVPMLEIFNCPNFELSSESKIGKLRFVVVDLPFVLNCLHSGLELGDGGLEFYGCEGIFNKELIDKLVEVGVRKVSFFDCEIDLENDEFASGLEALIDSNIEIGEVGGTRSGQLRKRFIDLGLFNRQREEDDDASVIVQQPLSPDELDSLKFKWFDEVVERVGNWWGALLRKFKG